MITTVHSQSKGEQPIMSRHMNFIVGSPEAPSKVFLLFFLFSDWLKLNHLRSRIKHGFFCRADQKTGGALLEFSGRPAMHGKSRVSSTTKYDCFKFDESGNCIIRKRWLHCIWFEKKFRLNEVIPHCTRSVNCRLCLQNFNEYHGYEYSPMNKFINKVLADL